ARLDLVGVVALVGAAGRAAAGGGHGERGVQQEGGGGGAQSAGEAGHPVALGLLGLVSERGEQVAVRDDVGACRERGVNLARQVVAPIGGEQDRHAQTVATRRV